MQQMQNMMAGGGAPQPAPQGSLELPQNQLNLGVGGYGKMRPPMRAAANPRLSAGQNKGPGQLPTQGQPGGGTQMSQMGHQLMQSGVPTAKVPTPNGGIPRSGPHSASGQHSKDT